MKTRSQERRETSWLPVVIVIFVVFAYLLMGYLFWYAPGQAAMESRQAARTAHPTQR